MSGTFTIGGLAAGLSSGQKIIGPLTITGNEALGQVTDILLAMGSNTVPVPTGAYAVLIVPPTNYTGTLIYKTVVGDTGSYISPSNPTVIAFDPNNTPTNLYLVASSSSGSNFAELSFI